MLRDFVLRGSGLGWSSWFVLRGSVLRVIRAPGGFVLRGFVLRGSGWIGAHAPWLGAMGLGLWVWGFGSGALCLLGLWACGFGSGALGHVDVAWTKQPTNRLDKTH